MRAAQQLRKWTKIHSTRPVGHAFYIEGDPSRVAVADDSGDGPPDTTDDGILWLQTDGLKALTLETNGFGNLSALISVQDEKGRRDGHVSITPTDAAFLANHLGLTLRILVAGMLFNHAGDRIRYTRHTRALVDIVTGGRTSDDWRCPTCRARLASIEDDTLTCIKGHESQ